MTAAQQLDPGTGHTVYRIGTADVDADDAALPDHLVAARNQHLRPLCLCSPAGTPMYIARIPTGELIVKRMPGTGVAHRPGCSSYEPPAELSGLAQVAGQAIDEQPDTTVLKLSFALSTGTGQAPPPPSESESSTATADPAKLTLRGLLHYLWDDAELTRWHPAMSARRNWGVVHRRLLGAVDGKTAKRNPLGANLYVPEPFRVDDRDAIIARRRRTFRGFAPVRGKRSQPVMLVIAEVKDFAEARFGNKIVLKQAPDTALLVHEKLFAKIGKVFATQLALWRELDDTHLILAGTATVGPSGHPALNEVVLMCTTGQWIPFDTGAERELIDSLTSHERTFVRSLRYNLGSAVPLAAATLTDTDDAVTGLYIADTVTDAECGPTVTDLAARSELPSWIWDTEHPLPPLPERRAHEPGTR